MVFLVLDPGLTIGYAIFSNTKLLETGIIKLSKRNRDQNFAYEIQSICKKYRVARIILEDAALTEDIFDMLVRYAYFQKEKITAYSPNQVRLALFGNNDMKKSEAIKLTKNFIPDIILLSRRFTSHELDSITLGIFYLKYIMGMDFSKIKPKAYQKHKKKKYKRGVYYITDS